MVEHAVSSDAPAEGETLDDVSAIKRGLYSVSSIEYEALQNFLKTALNKIDAQLGEMAAYEKRIAELEAVLENLKRDYESQATVDLNTVLKTLESRNQRIAELEAKCDSYGSVIDLTTEALARSNAERDQLAASLETARKALFLAYTQNANCLNGSAERTCKEALAQIANPPTALEERDRAVAKRCIEICKSELGYMELSMRDVVRRTNREFGLEE